MNIICRRFKLILGIALLMMLASCVTSPYIPNDGSVGNLSVKQARKIIKDAQWVGSSARITSDKLIIMGKSSQFVYRFSELPTIQLPKEFEGRAACSCAYDIHKACDCSSVLLGQTEFHIYGYDANNFANALYVLRRNAINQKNSIAEYDANFTASLTGYRNKAISNTVLPEEANRYKVQAEGAVRDKQFDDAADLYEEALKIVPWWPVGHFNRALLLGETGDYEMAIGEMKRYLQLVLDAPNARAAQDKIYE